jgi:putative spermidine/putrescine transport system ATP-binding protein
MTMSDLVVVMRLGHVEQVGPPLEVYRKPATAFVARFIGNTNLLQGTALADGRVRVRDAEFTAEGVTQHEGDRVVISVRPEDTHLETGDGSGGGNALEGSVVFVRDLGELFECYVDCGLDEHVVVAGSPRERMGVGQGDRVRLRFPPEACVVVGESP